MRDFRAFLITEVRIYKVKDHYYADESFAKIIERYKKGFGKIVLATRILNEQEVRKGFIAIDDHCRAFLNIGSLKKFLSCSVSSDIKEAIDESDLVIMRLPSVVSLRIYGLILKYKKKYLVEVMGCAWDGYWNHGLIGKIVAPFMFFKIRKYVRNANYALYVTQSFLQNRYPCRNTSIGISNVNIDCVGRARDYAEFDNKKITLMTAAALDVRYKGQEYVIRAIRKLKSQYKIDAKYYLAGKGDAHRLEGIALQNGVLDSLVILGMIPRKELNSYMDTIDIYLQPSLQEGLPRSLIEAMSRGAVCLGSETAGIPELLKKNELFRRRDSDAIVKAILRVIASRSEMQKISSQNIEVAKRYLNEVLELRRNNFFRMILKEIRK